MRTHAVKEETLTVLHNLFIAVLVFGWLIPVFWLILVSFTGDLHGPSLSQFFPQRWSGENYVKLFTVINDVNQFPRWFLNTLIVAICSTIVSTLFVLVTAFAFSRFRFKKRKGLMNLSMIIALFPGMLTMLVSYYLFEYVFKINSGLVRLIIAYSAASGLGYLVAKGFFDTIPTSIDEAAKLDGASSFTIFFKILVPLSKPIIIYTIITAFLSPWVDFVFAKIILGNSALPPEYTVAMGLINLISAGNILDWFGAFAAGSVIISIPLSILFLIVQKYYVGGVTGGAVKG
ncbi:MAG: ABC transporter permease subunit [Erysipelotrichaceae bacterium]|nr:ABC transporter permease subunit [Erysipelotrichaceae bacterium]